MSTWKDLNCTQRITTPRTVMANAGAVPDLATVVQHITNANPASMSTLAQSLKSFAPEEQRDAILGGLLPGAQDPLAILDPRANTLGYLYIL
jgi:COP9 signalosome complex subunit 3